MVLVADVIHIFFQCISSCCLEFYWGCLEYIITLLLNLQLIWLLCDSSINIMFIYLLNHSIDFLWFPIINNLCVLLSNLTLFLSVFSFPLELLKSLFVHFSFVVLLFSVPKDLLNLGTHFIKALLLFFN